MFLQGVVQPLLGYWVVSDILYFHPENTKRSPRFFFYPNKKEGLFCMPSMYLMNFPPFFFAGGGGEVFNMFSLGVFFLLLLSYPNKFVAVFNL